MKNWGYRVLTFSIFIMGAVAILFFVISRKQDEKTVSTPKVKVDMTMQKSFDMTNGLSDNLVEDAEILVEKVEGMPEDFIRAVDMSEVIAQEQSGVVYYNQDGEPSDIFKILANSGINYVKVRIWNDPYTLDGESYGGGNCDLDNAIEVGKRAAKYGMKLMVAFQYSDFYADASRQHVPKAWRNLGLEEKSKALSDFTIQSLQAITSGGGSVGIVQIGNETLGSLAGEKDWNGTCTLLQAGTNAVRSYAESTNQEMKIALNFTNPEDEGYFLKIAETIHSYGIDYDVFSTSYYSFWNGSLSNLTKELKSVADAYSKEVMVSETSFVYTLSDSDGYENTIYDEMLINYDYEVSVQGQADMIRDTIQAVVDTGNGIGVCYADAAWITVGDNYETNKIVWEKFGSGWATSFASTYDENIKGLEGGSDVDNEALFDRHGKVLASIKAFVYAYSGAVPQKENLEEKQSKLIGTK